MTDSEKGLATAAEWGTSLGKTTFQYTNLEILEEGDELVRCKDVKALIIRVQNQYSKHQDWEDNSEQQAIVDSLTEELLEELEQ